MLDKAAIASRLSKDEGNKPSAYQDSRGYWTIGRGYLIDSRVGGVLPDAVNDFWLGNLIDKTIAQLADFPSLGSVDDVRKQLVVCLLYNMGESHLAEFHQMLAALESGNYGAAADQLVNSTWYTQVGVRGPLYVRILRNGVWE